MTLASNPLEILQCLEEEGPPRDVTVVDDLSTGSFSNLSTVKNNIRFEFVEGDIVELPELTCGVFHQE